MTNTIRWNKPKQTPGVGDYDLTRFKSINMASQTLFTCNPPQNNIKVKNTRAASALNNGRVSRTVAMTQAQRSIKSKSRSPSLMSNGP